jgi:hypothetical protein
MPLITAKRSGPCATCGLTVTKGEQAWYTQAGGLRHPEPTCSTAPAARHRPNQRAGTCRCGRRVPARAGRLQYLGGASAPMAATWAVRCEPPGPRC